MKIARFNDNRLGAVEGDIVFDVTDALSELPIATYPLPRHDPLIGNLALVTDRARKLRPNARHLRLEDVKLLSPVASPSKVIGAPVNYLRHQAEAIADGGVNFDAEVKTISTYGLFLKANSSICGASEGVVIRHEGRRTDHEIELVVVIGKAGRDISYAQALDHVCGYTIGLDMTIRGPEDRSLRKSLDSFSVVGPWLTTKEEIPNPDLLSMQLSVNGNVRQDANTSDLIFDVRRLVEYASSFYELLPGDLIFTGTPEGVAEVNPGDIMKCQIEKLGAMSVPVIAGKQRASEPEMKGSLSPIAFDQSSAGQSI